MSYFRRLVSYILYVHKDIYYEIIFNNQYCGICVTGTIGRHIFVSK
jgi:hypothetical protein